MIPLQILNNSSLIHTPYFRLMNIQSALVVDDEIDICLLLQNFLSKKNIKTEFATTLKQGLIKFGEQKPALLILDHNLKDGFGIDKIADFRKMNPELYLIIISAMSNLKSKAMENGANLFMEKPVSFKLLNEIISNNPGD